MKKFSYIVLVLVLGFACRKKEYPKSMEENSPVFFTKATIDNEVIDFNAGQNGYQVFSSYTQDSNNIYRFIADLKKNDCGSACPNSLKIQINDYKALAPNAAVMIDSSLMVKKYDYLREQAGPSYEVRFPGHYYQNNQTASSYRWDFGDGSEISTQVAPSHIYKHPGNYTICLEVVGSNGCIATACNVVRVGPGNPLNAFIVQGNTGINWAKFDPAIQGGRAPYKYYWSFGDGTFSTDSNPTHTYSIRGSYPVELRVTDADNNTVTSKYNYVGKNDPSSCAVNFNPIISEVPYAYALSKISISWTDVNGVQYRSSSESQPVSSFFEIVSVENYDNNENNERTKKLRIKFKCNVYNGAKTLAINDAEAVICVAYK